MKLQKYIAPISALMFMVPLFASAQGVPPPNNLVMLIQYTSFLIGLLVPIAISLALLFFIWGLVTFIRNSGEEEALEEGKRKMIWGIIALFVIIAIWGLVGFIIRSTGITPEAVPTPDLPDLPLPR